MQISWKGVKNVSISFTSFLCVGFHSEAGVGKNLWNLVDNESTNLGCMEKLLEPW